MRCVAPLIRPSENGASSSGQTYANSLRRKSSRPAEQWPLDEVFHSNQRAPALPLARCRSGWRLCGHPGPESKGNGSGIRACRSLSSTKPVLCSCRVLEAFRWIKSAQHVEVEAEVYSATFTQVGKITSGPKEAKPFDQEETNMFDSTRRRFFTADRYRVATVGVSGVILHSDARPDTDGNQDQSERIMIQMGPTPRRA